MADGSQGQVDDLEALARSRFGELTLTEAEQKLLRAAARGEFAVCGPSADDSDPDNDPAKADGWGSEREIRAELIRWLCVNREAAKRVDPRGVRAHAAKVTGKLDLSFAVVPFPLGLLRCRLTDDADLTSVQIPVLSLDGSWTRSVSADRAKLADSVYLRQGFTAEGEVRLLGAQIGGDLDCNDGTFKNPGGKALSADRVNIGGSVFLPQGFAAEGEVRLIGAQIGSNLDCTGGTFKNPGGKALGADRVNVGGSVYLPQGFAAEGEVRLLGAQIGGDLDCNGGRFKNPGGYALTADGVNVTGGVFLRQGFAEGEVRLLGAQIGGNLECDGSTFKNPPRPEKADTYALSADGVNVAGAVFFRQGFAAEGGVRLLGAQIGGDLDCRGGTFSALNAETAVIKGGLFWRNVQNAERTQLNLINASAGAIVDDEESWPKQGKLSLDGFTYARISAGPTDAKRRLEWLARLRRFTLQPYRQLAKVLREAGDGRGARQVLFEMEHRRREEIERPRREEMEREGPNGKNRSQLRRRWSWVLNRLWRLWSWVLKWTIGYGHMPGRALGWLLGLTLSGFVLSGLGYLSGAIAPSQKEAYPTFQEQGQPPDYYPRFNPLIYSLEHSFPLVNLGQKDHWAPNPPGPGHAPSPLPKWLQAVGNLGLFGYHRLRLDHPTFLRGWLWCQTLAGWVLATLFVAGLTGIVRSE